MITIIGIVGKSKSGKTTLICKLIREVSQRGYNVAAIKHSRHNIDIDQPGKDSMLMYEAGASAVAVSSENKVAMYMDVKDLWSPEDVAVSLFPKVDIVLVEGFSESTIPKIGVLREENSNDLFDEKGMIAIVSDMDIKTNLPTFSSGQTREIADMIEKHIKKTAPRRNVRLYVDEKKIFIKPFIKNFFLKTISAMVDSLKGTQDAQTIKIIIYKT